MIGLKAEIEGRWALLEGDICLWLENDDSWIDGNPPGDGGVFVGFLDVSREPRRSSPGSPCGAWACASARPRARCSTSG